jgi:hypothetical protein
MRYGRNTDGSFTSGNAGKPRGSRNKATVAIESLLEGQAEALTQKAILPQHLREIQSLLSFVWTE